MTAIQRPKGTQDLLPDGSPKLKTSYSARWHRYLIEESAKWLERAGARYIQTPMFEQVDVVKRGVGDTTDIVRKEMFTVTYQGDHGGYILRPEGTAPIVRAYLENGLKQLGSPLKLWTHGAMFRAENVQQGRQRQFHQLDYEVLGSEEPLIDAEAIALMWEVLDNLGLRAVELKLGSIGDPEDRNAYNAYLRTLFTAHSERLSKDSLARLEANPMRILDSKEFADQTLIAELQPLAMLDWLRVTKSRDEVLQILSSQLPQDYTRFIEEYFGESEQQASVAGAHLHQVCHYLKAWSIPYTLDPTIVRGLDYYRRTAWEVHHAHIGAKSALGGGGRYDGLASNLGGQHTPGIGWALGIERVLIALEQENVPLAAAEPMLLYIGALEEDLLAQAANVARVVRRAGQHAEFAYKAKSPGAHLKDAIKKGARFAALLGSEEASTGHINLKNLATGEQTPVAQSELLSYLGVL